MMRLDRHRRTWVLLLSALAVCATIAMIASPVQAERNPKLSELEQKIADLNLLYQQLGDRMTQAQAIRKALSDQNNEITSEIQVLAKSLKISNLQQAMDHLRMHYNVELLRTILAYMDELDEKIQSYQSGRERLGYLRRLAEDDIRMIATLSDLKIDALTTQISLVVNRYLPDAHVIQIDPQKVSLLSTRQVWERVRPQV